MSKLTHSLAFRTTLLALLLLLFSGHPTAAGSIPFGNQTIIATAADGAISVRVADLDGDGDLDVLSASAIGNEIAWYENDGNQNFTPHSIATIIPPDADGATSVFTADHGSSISNSRRVSSPDWTQACVAL